MDGILNKMNDKTTKPQSPENVGKAIKDMQAKDDNYFLTYPSKDTK